MRTAPPPQAGRAALIAAAVRLFQARGYHGVGVSDILSEAGLPKGSLYHHFPAGKEELAAAAVAFIADEVDARITTLLQKAPDPQAALRTIARATASWLKQTGFQQGALIGALAAAVGPDTPLLSAAVRHAYARWTTRFAAAAKGRDASANAQAALAWLEGAILLARATEDIRGLMNPPALFADHSAEA